MEDSGRHLHSAASSAVASPQKSVAAEHHMLNRTFIAVPVRPINGQEIVEETIGNMNVVCRSFPPPRLTTSRAEGQPTVRIGPLEPLIFPIVVISGTRTKNNRARAASYQRR